MGMNNAADSIEVERSEEYRYQIRDLRSGNIVARSRTERAAVAKIRALLRRDDSGRARYELVDRDALAALWAGAR